MSLTERGVLLSQSPQNCSRSAHEQKIQSRFPFEARERLLLRFKADGEEDEKGFYGGGRTFPFVRGGGRKFCPQVRRHSISLGRQQDQ